MKRLYHRLCPFIENVISIVPVIKMSAGTETVLNNALQKRKHAAILTKQQSVFNKWSFVSPVVGDPTKH